MAEEPTDTQLVSLLQEAKVAIVEALGNLGVDDEVGGFAMSNTTFSLGASPSMAAKLGPKFKPGFADARDSGCTNVLCGPDQPGAAQINQL